MAIARTDDPAAVARRFADEISAIPEVKRAWYWSKLGHHVPELLSLDLFVLLARSDDQIEAAVTRATMHVNECSPEMMLAVISFTEEQVAEWGAEAELRDGSIEIPLRGVRT